MNKIEFYGIILAALTLFAAVFIGMNSYSWWDYLEPYSYTLILPIFLALFMVLWAIYKVNHAS